MPEYRGHGRPLVIRFVPALGSHQRSLSIRGLEVGLRISLDEWHPVLDDTTLALLGPSPCTWIFRPGTLCWSG